MNEEEEKDESRGKRWTSTFRDVRRPENEVKKEVGQSLVTGNRRSDGFKSINSRAEPRGRKTLVQEEARGIPRLT